jgi:monovalent cation:proton antiporter-2 (CPA2) family protein
MTWLGEITIFLAAAVLAALFAKRLGLGSVLGYLLAGMLIGPWGFSLIFDVDSILHFAELGVVFLLFIIGLELQPARLWSLRKAVIGLGASQVAITAFVISAASYFVAGQTVQTAFVIGAGLSLSSTALAIQTLSEKRQMTTRHGRAAFSLLLFQDLAAIPIIALVPLLALTGEDATWTGVAISISRIVGVIAVVVLGGHFLLRHVFRIVAATGIREAFTAIALLTVIGTALLVDQVGLSMGLGAFLAGVLLADSEYRHELEAGIEPFKGLLLGLFFIAVGMSVNLGITMEKPDKVILMVISLVTFKFAVIYSLGRISGLARSSAGNFAVLTSQGGEFAFVIFASAGLTGLLSREVVDELVLAVTLSMVATPLLFLGSDAVFRWRHKNREPETYELPDNDDPQVIIAGFGRFGQIIGRILQAKKVRFTALEMSTHQVDFVRRFGDQVYYGDATRIGLLRAAGAETAEVFVLAIDDVERSLNTAEIVAQHFPHMKIFARARNRAHAYALMDLGVTHIRRETFLSSVELGREVLTGLGMPEFEAETAARKFRDFDERRLAEHYGEVHTEEQAGQLAREWADELEEMFARDEDEMDI